MPDPVYLEAIAELSRLLDEALHRGDKEARSCALATATPDGRPSVRTVALLRAGPGGLAMLVDTRTGKGRQLQVNPRAALCFHWPALEYQVIVEGDVQWLSEPESDDLWTRQTREYRVARWASDQTAPAGDREKVRERVRKVKRQYGFERIPRPPHWRALEVKPDRIDLWPTGWDRLRPRLHYARCADGAWSRSRESP